MSSTLVIQSHRQALPFRWLGACIDSVQRWAEANGYDYRWLGDELFAPLDEELRAKTCARPVIASDLARLRQLQQGLADGYRRVVWLDADFLVFAPRQFELPAADFALGREIWIQPGERAGWRAYAKVHNAFLMFDQDNAFLDFYADSAERLLRLNQGGMPPQFIGPKLLTALHNIVQCPVMETAAMLSPAVMRDLIAGGGDALRLLLEQSAVTPAGANLCSSLSLRENLDEAQMSLLIERLLDQGLD